MRRIVFNDALKELSETLTALNEALNALNETLNEHLCWKNTL
jgi:hypothetical protein